MLVEVKVTAGPEAGKTIFVNTDNILYIKGTAQRDFKEPAGTALHGNNNILLAEDKVHKIIDTYKPVVLVMIGNLEITIDDISFRQIRKSGAGIRTYSPNFT